MVLSSALATAALVGAFLVGWYLRGRYDAEQARDQAFPAYRLDLDTELTTARATFRRELGTVRKQIDKIGAPA